MYQVVYQVASIADTGMKAMMLVSRRKQNPVMMRFYACGITVIVVIALVSIGSQLRLIGRVDDGHPVQPNDTIETAPDGTFLSFRSNSSSVTKQQMIITLANVRRQCIDSIRAKHQEFYASSIIPKKHTTVLLVDPAYHGNVGT